MKEEINKEIQNISAIKNIKNLKRLLNRFKKYIAYFKITLLLSVLWIFFSGNNDPFMIITSAQVEFGAQCIKDIFVRDSEIEKNKCNNWRHCSSDGERCRQPFSFLRVEVDKVDRWTRFRDICME